ncbi:tripartite tricarboxylate transporter TctB family protein [Roseibium algae]|uniref:Tripartite tricarboxylate transporter TctB family protein n=1 Tax=Roseibium algae TaxID=3123038 RepID=A0ABU8TNZ2_9HYPH
MAEMQNARVTLARCGFPLFLMVLTTAYLVATYQIRVQFSEGLVGPRFMPFLAAGLTYICLLRILWKETRNSDDVGQSQSLVRPAIVVVVTIGYVALFEMLGYAISTFIFSLCLFGVFGFERERPVFMLLYAAAVTFVFYLLFGVAFDIRLPVIPGIL